MNGSSLSRGGVPIALAILLALGLPAAARGQASELLSDGKEQSAPVRAVSAEDYRRALSKATTPEEQIELSLGLARVLSEEVAQKIDETGRLYADAVAYAAGPQILPARNAYGVFLLRLNRFEQAADVFAGGLTEARNEQSDPVARSRFLYNYATALESTGRPTEASPVYRESLVLAPGFRRASDALLRVSSALPRPQAARAWSDLLGLLLDQGDLEGAVQYMRDRWERDEDWTLAYARYLTALDLSPQNYPPVDFYQDLTGCEEWYPESFCARVSLINLVFSRNDLPLLLNPEDGKKFTLPWQTTSESAHVFSNLLKSVGDAYAREGNHAAALPRYALSWSSDLNLEAAISLAGMLAGSRGQVDLGGQVLGFLTSAEFQEGSETYRQAGWENILRFHSVLAEIFERQGQSGTPADPRSAVFQLEHALEAHQQLAASSPLDKKLETLPHLHVRLANAYSKSANELAAFDHYREASEQFVAIGRPEAATIPLRKAEELAKFGSTSSIERLHLVQQEVAAERTRFLSSAERKDQIAVAGRIGSLLSGDPETFPGAVSGTIEADIIILSGEVGSRAKSAEIENLIREDLQANVRNEIRVARVPSIPDSSVVERIPIRNRRNQLFGDIIPLIPRNLAAEHASNLRYSVVVDRFENKSKGPHRLGDEWGTILVSALQESNHFIVVAQDDMQLKALEEQLRGLSGITAHGRKTAARGRMTPAQLLVKGVITHFQEGTANQEGGFDIGGIRINAGRKKTEVRGTLQLIDATTGAIVASKNFIGTAQERGFSIGDRHASMGEDDKVHEALEKAISDVVPWMISQLYSVSWRGTVVKIAGDRIIINRGAREGVKVGNEFIAGDSEVLSDPETGETLEEIVHDRARIRVVEVSERTSACSVIKGDASQIVEGMGVQYSQEGESQGQR